MRSAVTTLVVMVSSLCHVSEMSEEDSGDYVNHENATETAHCLALRREKENVERARGVLSVLYSKQEHRETMEFEVCGDDTCLLLVGYGVSIYVLFWA